MSKLKGILEISDILNDYSQDIQNGITNLAQQVAKNGAKKLKSTSPISKRNTKHRGSYSKGWRVKTTKGRGFVNCVIHNSTDYQLTHLLEKEHSTHNGGKYVPPKKHIEPVHDECCINFENGVEDIIKNGG